MKEKKTSTREGVNFSTCFSTKMERKKHFQFKRFRDLSFFLPAFPLSPSAFAFLLPRLRYRFRFTFSQRSEMADAMGHVASGASSSASVPGGLLGVLAAISLGIARPLGISPQAVSSTLAYVGWMCLVPRRLELEERDGRRGETEVKGGSLIRAKSFAREISKKTSLDSSNQAASLLPFSRSQKPSPPSKPASSIFLVSGIALGFPSAARWLSGGEFFEPWGKKKFFKMRETLLRVALRFFPFFQPCVLTLPSLPAKKNKPKANTKSRPRSPSSSSPTPSAPRCS